MKSIAKIFVFIYRYGLLNFYYSIINNRTFKIQETNSFQVGNTSITDSEMHTMYGELCRQASKDNKVFKNFRSYQVMIQAIDHVTIAQGELYIDEIERKGPWRNQYSQILNKIDSIGNPKQFRFKHGKFSPTLLRYLKVYSDLVQQFGPLRNLSISEIGVGFGGQSSLISLIDQPIAYNLYDIPPVLELSQLFMSTLRIPRNFKSFDGRNPYPSNQDLVLSNYAFSELNREIQSQYLESVILRSARGYITWNDLSQKYLNGFSLAELLRLIPNSEIVPEVPNTSLGNSIIIWGR